MTIIDSNNEYTGIDDAILFPINDPNQAERVPVEDFSAFITQTAEQKRHDEQTLPIVLQSYYTLANATLSSDGQYALVLLQNGEDQYCYKLMDLTTLQLRTVNVPTDLLSAMQAYHSGLLS